MALETVKQNPSIPFTHMPAHIIVGHPAQTLHYAEMQLRAWACPGVCGICRTCKQITERAHHAMLWVTPEKGYTLDDLNDVFNTLSFALEPNEHYFFVLTKADTLSAACANRLLKSLEEPPAGYHFILLAERLEHILPTIRSRCITHQLTPSHHERAHQMLIDWFTHGSLPAATTFLKYLDDNPITEHETPSIVDAILTSWATRYAQALTEDKTREITAIETTLATIRTMYPILPMPGSSKLFWKNLYLQFMK